MAMDDEGNKKLYERGGAENSGILNDIKLLKRRS